MKNAFLAQVFRVAAVVALFAAAEPVAALAETGVEPGRILFGQAAALSGPAASLGQDMRRGLLAAFDEANRAGGVNGRILELVSLDDGYDPGRSVDATRKLIQDEKVFALVGAVGTPTSLATEPIAAEAGVPFIGAFTGAEFLRTPFKPNVVNVRASYFEETEAMIERLVKDRGSRRIAVLYQDDAFGRTGLEGVMRALEKRSMTLAAEGSFERNTTAIKSALLTIREANPDAVILVGPYKPCAVFIKLARSLGLKSLFLNTSFAGSVALARELGSDGEGVFATQVTPSPWDRSLPIVGHYQDAMIQVEPKAEFGFVSLEGYIAGRLLIAALQNISTELTRQKLLDAIFDHRFDLGGVTLNYGTKSNQGSNVVFLSLIHGEGTISMVPNLAQ